MDRPVAHATYGNAGLPAMFFVAGAALMCIGLTILAIVTIARGDRDGFRVFIAVAAFGSYGVFVYLRSPIGLSLAPGFISIRYPFAEPHWIPVSAVQGVIRHGRLGRTCEITVGNTPGTWTKWLTVELHLNYFTDEATGRDITDEVLLAAIPQLKVDDSFRNRFR
jgi:hypothetical protein